MSRSVSRLASALAVSAALATTLGLAACVPTSDAPGIAPQPRVSEQLMADLTILSADDMEGRGAGTPGGERARNYIVGRFEALGLVAPPVGRFQPFEAEGRSPQGRMMYNGVNIMGMVTGTRVPDRYIVVTAHYDHVGMHDGQIFNGADDNASGVASMLALAEALKAAPPEHSVLFVAFDAEERGLLGARYFVEVPPMPLDSMVVNLNLDMTARAETDGRLWVTGTYQNPALRPLLEPIAPIGAVALAFGKDRPEDTGADNWVNASDHAAFHAAGVPFIYLGVDFHPDYHRPSDDADRIQPEVFQNSTDLAIAVFRALDRGLGR